MNTAPVVKPFERVDYALYAGLAGLKMWLHLATAARDGMFRDEYYYLACASRLDWGYVDQPPLSILLLAITRALFGQSVTDVRIPVILASGVLVVLIGLFARRLGGGRFAQGFSMLCLIACPMMLGVHSYYSMNTFDHLFWLIAAMLLVSILQTGNPRLWLWFGLACGLGLENKMSMLFFGFGVVVALALTPHRKWFLSPWLYAGGAVAFVVFLPNLLWQATHGFATLEFMHNAALYKNVNMPPLRFLLALIVEYHPLLVPVWIMGGLYPFVRSEARDLRVLPLAFLAILLVFMFGNGKTYYVAPAFLLLWPLGAVWIERLTEGGKIARPLMMYVLFFGGLATAPVALSFLPPKNYIEYSQSIGLVPSRQEKGHGGALPQHIADRLGWRKRAELVKKAYDSLPPEEQKKAVIYGSDYGEAGAMEYYAKELGLPPAISGHDNYWIWGPGDATGEVIILICDPDSEALGLFETTQDMGTVDEPYQLESWQGKHVYIARGLKQPIAALWPSLKMFI